MKKYWYIILVVALGAIAAVLFLVQGEEAPVVEENQVATSSGAEIVEPVASEPAEVLPKIVFGDTVCQVVSGRKYAKLPITISEKGWSYGETLVKPVDATITSNSGKTFENENMGYPFYEWVGEEWGESSVTVKIWKDKSQSPVAAADRVISVQKACK